jgi:hypothetical protein
MDQFYKLNEHLATRAYVMSFLGVGVRAMAPA